jgi:hypothetical protein
MRRRNPDKDLRCRERAFAGGGGSREEDQYLRELGRRGLLWVTFVAVSSSVGSLRLHEAGINPRGHGYKKRILREWRGGRLRCLRKGNNMRAVLEDWRDRYGARSRVLELREAEEVLTPEERGWRYRDEWRAHARSKIREGKKSGQIGWNPDEGERALERAAAGGDPHAQRRFLERLTRTGELPSLDDPVYMRLLIPGFAPHPSGEGIMETEEVSVSFTAANAMEFVDIGTPILEDLKAHARIRWGAPDRIMVSLEVLDRAGHWHIAEGPRVMNEKGTAHSTLYMFGKIDPNELLWSARESWTAAVATSQRGEPEEAGCTCEVPDAVTCGNCERSWCERCDPTPGPLCHFCHGRGDTDAELYL